jgi:DnaJ-domain-containing protein 1
MDANLQRLIARLGVAIMSADGRIAPSELDALERLDELGLGPLSGLAREEIERAMGEPIDLRATCAGLAGIPPEATALVLAALAEIAASDRALSPREAEVFASVARGLGLNAAEASYALNTAFDVRGGVKPPEAGAAPAPGGAGELPPRGVKTSPAIDPRIASAERVLGVVPGASRDELEAAYLARVQRYNPGRMAELGPEFAALAVHRLADITAAYETAVGAVGGRG